MVILPLDKKIEPIWLYFGDKKKSTGGLSPGRNISQGVISKLFTSPDFTQNQESVKSILGFGFL
jgi:hypothetical protein